MSHDGASSRLRSPDIPLEMWNRSKCGRASSLEWVLCATVEPGAREECAQARAESGQEAHAPPTFARIYAATLLPERDSLARAISVALLAFAVIAICSQTCAVTWARDWPISARRSAAGTALIKELDGDCTRPMLAESRPLRTQMSLMLALLTPPTLCSRFRALPRRAQICRSTNYLGNPEGVGQRCNKGGGAHGPTRGSTGNSARIGFTILRFGRESDTPAL